jgi:thiol:disulfide interchange protein DsbD
MIGLSAGKLLPRAGVWMDAVKSIFGIGLIAVAIWLLSRILPSSVSLMLWSVLLIITSIYVANVDASQGPHNGFKVFRRGLGIAILIYGVILMVGAAAGGSDPLLPLEVLNTPRQFANKEDAHQSARFKRVSTLVELKKEIEHASSNGRFVMLDFYADWCVSCKEMERYTFGDPEVSENLKGISLLQVDLTSNSDHGNQILREFSLIGPPAVLFFGPDKTEKKGKRLIGFVEPKKFIDHLRGVL